ncbi:MAG: folate-binding protein [Gordonia sp. (in: high G+C Gram-positive bacteria)]
MTRSPILTRYSGEGAVASPDTGAVAWHFGDPLGEQRAAASGVIVVDRSDRSVIELPGPDRLTWLNTICSQKVDDLADRHSAEALSLDANGRVEDHFILTDLDGVTWIDTEPERGGPLLDFLTKMVFWSAVYPAARADVKVITLIGPGALHGPVADLIEIPPTAVVHQADDLPESHHDDEPLGFWRRMPSLSQWPHAGGGDGHAPDLPVVDLLVPETALLPWWAELVEAGATMAGTWAYDALRVTGIQPRLGVDTDDRTIPHETGWIGSAVHLDKGCYRGQETVARVHNLGKAPRQLVLLHLDGSDDHRPATGDPITAGGRRVGRVGTVIDHTDLGPVALGLVKRGISADIDLVAGDEFGVAARIDPDSVIVDDRVQAGRVAVERLRGSS